MNNHLTELVITCSSWQEAQRVADALLEKRLVSSIETFQTNTDYSWENQTHGAVEVRLIVLTLAKYFEQIEAETLIQHKLNTKPILITEAIKQ